MRPKASRAVPTRPSTWAGSVTSAGQARDPSPISAASSFRAPALRAASTTLAPAPAKARAAAFPIPELLPTTTATWPLSCAIGSLCQRTS